jgi:hypothetical protein
VIKASEKDISPNFSTPITLTKYENVTNGSNIFNPCKIKRLMKLDINLFLSSLSTKALSLLIISYLK